MKLPTWLTKKEGPLPVWGYIVIGGVAYVLIRWYQNKQAAAAATGSTGIVSPQPVYSNGSGATAPATTGGGGGGGAATGLVCPTNFSPDSTGTICLPTAAYLASLLPAPTTPSSPVTGNPSAPTPVANVPQVSVGGSNLGGGTYAQGGAYPGSQNGSYYAQAGPASPSAPTFNGQQTVPSAGLNPATTAPPGTSGLNNTYSGYAISPQEQAYLSGGAAGEQNYLQNLGVPFTQNNQPVGAPPAQNQNNCPAGTRWLPGVGGPGACVPFNLPIGAPV